MGCCNERGLLRPLLSGSAASRNGNSNTSSASNSSSPYSRNKRHRKGNKRRGVASASSGISHHPSNGYDGMNSEHYNDDDDYYDDEFGDEDEVRSCAYWWKVTVTMLRKIGLLVWKNLLLRRRHYIVTALEIILPTLCAMILALGKTQTGGSGPDSHHAPSFQSGNETIVFPANSEEHLIQKLQLKSSCDNCYFAYAPQNANTDAVIGQLEAVLKGSKAAKFKSYQNEEEIEKLVASLNFNNTARGAFRGAVVFENDLDYTRGRVSYKIRLVDEFHDTGLLFPVFQLPGPNFEHLTKYVDSGFIGLQLELDKILASNMAQKPIPFNMALQAFPYPPFSISLDFSMFYFILLPTLFVLGFIFMVPSIVRVVVSEKDSGIRELLKLNGLPGWMQWLGWMVNSMIIMTISITIVVFFLFWTFKMEAGAVLVYSSPTVWWFILFLYTLSASAFCFFVSSLPLKPTLATTVGIMLWLSSYFFLFPRLEKDYQMSSFTEKLGVALQPNLALYLAVKVMCAFEGKAVGAHWYNIAEPLSSVDPLTLGHVILMFLVNTTMYMFLTVYIENVFPSEYGVRKPWYYIFQARTWCPRRSTVDRVTDNEVDFDQNMPGFEPHPAGTSVGVEIVNLRKTFGRNKVAVNGVCARMYDGEIFALLGHNGAGKTTTISMLTGLFAPSGGTATVNGYDITTDLDSVRSSLGLCPQHNMLFDKLTVIEHLRFFGQLKGLTPSEATKESKEILKKIQLSDKETTLSMALSGGQKRKLMLSIALIGGTKVVILDEPTSGMDPEARRAIWDLLLEMRGQRTILLTTHFMEEADVLGDRIGIMANGKLQCCGTPIFLKKFYGTGYSLKVSLDESEKRDELLRCVQAHIGNASIKNIHNNNSSELILSLPTETATTAKLSEMFSELTDFKAKLGIRTLGLSLTTMDEVFLRVGELTEDQANANVENGTSSVDGSPDTSHRTNDERSNLKTDRERAQGLKLVKEQFMALLVKKYIYTIRKRKLMLSQLLMPIAILALTILASNANFETPDPPPALKITLDSYKHPVTLFSATDEEMASAMMSVIGPSATKVAPGTTVLQTISDLGKNDLASYRERHIIAEDFSQNNYTAMFNSIPTHAAPLAINTATNTILKKLTSNSNFRIEVTNHPFQSRMESLLEAAKPDPIFSQTVPIMFAVFMPIGLALLAASFIVFPIEEQLCKAKQLQMMSGVSPLTYWSSAFAWDFFIVVLVICAMTLCFPIFQTYNVFTSYGGAGVAFLILLIFGYSAISFSYVVSLFSSTVTGGFAFVSILHVASGMILCIVVHVMEIGELLGLAEKLRWFGRIFPTFGAAISTMRYSEIASKNGRCNILSDEAKHLICDPKTTTVPGEYRECCDNCGDFIDSKCFKPTPYITWNYEKNEETSSIVPGIGQELLYMVIMAIIYQVVLLLLEYGIIQKLLSKLFRTDESVFQSGINDDDVKKESERVANLVASGNTNEDALVVDNLCKSFGSFAAVSRLSFGVHHGECFGLLGVNGAGKTTTFRMLTGDEYRSHGNAYAFMNTLDRNRKQFNANIGYCPQFDGIIGVLSGREMLQLFCRLRGVPGKYGQMEADKWLTKLGLFESASVQCRKYSGGMKRRLSVAMAMIGDPPILLLDEPTSGVDPVSRRQFWQVLGAVRDSGQSIILTSHSMEECEALCSRLGIMVNGQLQCLGGVQHLKSKFAQGYSLSLKLKSMIPVESEDVKKLSEQISYKFAPCTLKDKHQNVLQYQVHNISIPWNALFKNMEDLKMEYGDIIEDYSVNETTLEEVFLSFARKQYGNRKADVSLLKRIITCQLC